jgi:hypothetical protein
VPLWTNIPVAIPLIFFPITHLYCQFQLIIELLFLWHLVYTHKDVDLKEWQRLSFLIYA